MLSFGVFGWKQKDFFCRYVKGYLHFRNFFEILGHVYANKELTLTGLQSKVPSFYKKNLKSFKVLSLDLVLRFLAY